MSDLDRAVRAFNAPAFCEKHGGYKESANKRSCEYLMPCWRCGSTRLRWNHPDKQTWICWGCHRSGSTLDLIQGLEGLSAAGAVHFVLDAYNGGDADWTVAPIAPRVDKPSIVPMPWPKGVQVLSPCAEHERGWRYLLGRGLTVEQIQHYQIGFGRAGRLKNYVVFPVWMGGHLVYWQGRATWDPPPPDAHELPLYYAERVKEWKRQTHYRKTLNPLLEGEQMGGGQVVFNYDVAAYYDHVVVCEGPIDAIKVGPHAVALFGKAAQPAKVGWLRDLPARFVTIYLDRGEKEQAAAQKLAGELQGSFEGVYLAEPPPGRDPGSMSVDENALVLASAQPVSSLAIYAGRMGRL